MILLESTLLNRQVQMADVNKLMDENEFFLGGNWDYDHGCYDRNLDEEQKVWLRIPFEVKKGKLDSELEDSAAEIKIGCPFVLKHLYNDGLDQEAKVETYGALVNQFQEPVDKDAEVEEKWIRQAEKLLEQVEKKWNQAGF